jgi:hypothetical protein
MQRASRGTWRRRLAGNDVGVPASLDFAASGEHRPRDPRRSELLAVHVHLAAVKAHAQAKPATVPTRAPIRYVTLDRMIRSFAEKARQEHAARPAPKPAVVVATR